MSQPRQFRKSRWAITGLAVAGMLNALLILLSRWSPMQIPWFMWTPKEHVFHYLMTLFGVGLLLALPIWLPLTLWWKRKGMCPLRASLTAALLSLLLPAPLVGMNTWYRHQPETIFVEATGMQPKAGVELIHSERLDMGSGQALLLYFKAPPQPIDRIVSTHTLSDEERGYLCWSRVTHALDDNTPARWPVLYVRPSSVIYARVRDAKDEIILITDPDTRETTLVIVELY